MAMDYQYPLDYTWSTDETVNVIQFFQALEDAYEKGISRDELMAAYRKFKEVVPGKAEEKKLCNEFEELSSYSAYRAVSAAKKLSSGERIKMK